MSMIMDLLPTLNEGDEHVSLGDILAIRDTCLSELELWAVCKECCLAIQGVHVSSDMFQTLCITPDSLAFDQSGTVFFLDLYTDPEPMYVPPEYENIGNSYKAHLYSLGMTLLYAAEYNVSLDNNRTFSTDLGQTINRMTLDDFEERASLSYVLDMCGKYLEGHDSDRICQLIVAIAESESEGEEDDPDKDITITKTTEEDERQIDTSISDTIVQLSKGPDEKETSLSSSNSPTSKTNPRKRASPDPLSGIVMPSENFMSTKLANGNNIDKDNTNDSQVGTPPKVIKVGNTPLNKRDPLKSILGSSISDGDDDVDNDNDTGGEPTSLEDITFIPEPPLTNDLDLKQWDMLFPLPPPPVTSQPQTMTDLTVSSSTEPSFDEDIINVSSMDSTLSVKTENDNSTSDKANTSESNNSFDTLNNVSYCEPSQSPTINIPIDVSNKVNDHVNNGENTSENTDRNSVENYSNYQNKDDQIGPLKSIKSPLNTPPLEGNTDTDLSQSQTTVGQNETIIKPFEVGTETLNNNNGEGLLNDKPQPLKHTHGGEVLESCTNLSEPVLVDIGDRNLTSLDEDNKTDDSHSTSSEAVTIKFNAVFGKHVHRDTSQDTLSLPQAEDVIKNGIVLSKDHGDIKATQECRNDTDNVFISGDLNSKSGSLEIDHKIDMSSGSYLHKRSRDRSGSSNEEGQSVMQVLERLCCGLHENEVWALCRECVLSMQRNRLQLPAYVSLETVVIEDTGRVTYKPVPEDKELEVVFLAPELQQFGVVTEKTCLFGVAAMLWSAADYRLPANQEPALSVDLENLLITMTQDDSDLRPTAIEVLQTCNEFQKKQTTTSTQICQSLASESRKALAFGKDNNLVQHILGEKIEKEAKNQKAELVQSLKGHNQVTLKPATDRPVAEVVVKEKTLHERLMEQIQKPPRKLRKSSKPRMMQVKEIFMNNPDIMEGLKRVMGKHRQAVTDSSPVGTSPHDHSAFDTVSKDTVDEIDRETGSVPEAYKSKTTHFAPIVLSNSPSKSQQQPKSKSTVEDKVNHKIQKMKENWKHRPPLTLVSDLEKDVLHEIPKTPINQGVPQMSPTSPNIYMSSPHSIDVPGAGTMPKSPKSNQIQNHQFQGQPHMPLSTSVPNLTLQYPMAAAPMQIGMQMQLQQDPRTGLFQLIPVPTAVPIQTIPVQQPQLYQSPSMSQISRTPTGQYTSLQGLSLSPIEKPRRSVSPPSGSSTDGEKPERRRRRKHPKEKTGSSRLSDSDSGSRSSNRNSSNGSNRSQSDKLYRGNRIDDADRELESYNHHGTNKIELSPVLEKRQPVPRASSVDLLEKYENGNSQPRTPRTVKLRDMRNKLKRAKSGSSVDFKNIQNSELKPYEIYDDSNIVYSKKITSEFSRSQPNLESELALLPSDNVVHKSSKSRTLRSERRKTDPASPEIPTPPLSPSLSKDSGVSGMNVKTSDMSLMERLLNSDTIRHQQRLSRIVRIVREEFAYDGYMENGIEDLAMAEYILSLGNLKWDTFYNAVTEKYCDLYFEDDVMSSLFEAVNGKKPPEKSVPGVSRLMGNTATVISVDEPRQAAVQHGNREEKPGVSLNLSADSPSAFRPIHSDRQQTPPQNTSPQDTAIMRPKATKYKKADHTAVGKGSNSRYKPTYGLDNGNRSSSLHDLLIEEEKLSKESSLIKSHSQEELLDPAGSNSAGLSSAPVRKPPRNMITNKTNGALNKIPQSYYTDDQFDDSDISTEHMSKLSYLVRQDSDSSSSKSEPKMQQDYRGGRLGQYNSKQLVKKEDSGSDSSSSRYDHKSQPESQNRLRRPYSHQPIKREGSDSSEKSSQSGFGKFRFPSETYLTTESVDSEDPKDRIIAAKPYVAEVPRVGRGSVVYYSAEMEKRLRKDVTDYAAQIDVKTKESIESKMAEIDQQMNMEHRNKKKTLKYYRKLVEATKSSKISNEHKAMTTKVGKQVEESNSRLDFLDSAKKHLEMLHAEQWGLDHTLLYALAMCPGDSAMLLCACDNPLLQYQLMRSPRLGIEGQILQAGTADGLLSYLFAQHALSEGYIHQFFYCYRYFTTSKYVFKFLYDKITAATLSLGPDADVPSKVKARAIDLMQVWIEGFYTVDFKHNSEIMEDFTQCIQEKILPVDESAEMIIEVIEKCEEGRHRDLYYVDFSAREDTNNNTTEDQSVKKRPSFMALFASPKQNKTKNSIEKRDRNELLRTGLKRADSFTLMDYATQLLAEQLTLLEQELFQQSHPVHYLNSKWLGVNVSLTNPIMHKSQSLQRLNEAFEGDGTSLFVGGFHGEQIIQEMIEHAQLLSFWVTAEVISAPTNKSQTAVLNKFIEIARYCQEIRNFATCIAIVDGLESLIVRQLPAWKSLSSKCMSNMEKLSSLKMLLKTDSYCLQSDKSIRHLPTIPNILYFLLHVQQLEIGGFKLANGMSRWSKMKSIASMIDQIRVFKHHPYSFHEDPGLQQSIQNRMEALSNQDLHTLAQHSINLPKKSDAFIKLRQLMKGKH